MKYPIEQIRDFCEKVWVNVGLAPEDAKTCVDVLALCQYVQIVVVW